MASLTIKRSFTRLSHGPLNQSAMAALPDPPKLLHAGAILSAVPTQVTPPGLSRRIATTAPLGRGLLQSHFRIVLYFGGAAGAEEDTVTLGAWIKESLSAALSEHPAMAGRLRRDNEASGYWEIKFNDCGARMVQARAEMSMAEFMGAEDRDRREAHLAYWAEVDEEEPNLSALFYIQLTQFQGGGYAIGISCSLLLCDPLFLGQFLRSWTQLHRTMAAQGRLTKPPLFHPSYVRRSNQPGCHLKSIELESSPDSTSSARAATVLFEVDRGSDALSCGAAAAAVACLGEAARNLEMKKAASSCCSIIISEHSGDAEVQVHDGTGLTGPVGEAIVGDGPREVSWLDRLGIEEVSFVDGRKPVHASCRVVSAVDGGLVVAMLPVPDGKELSVSVTIPAI